MKTTLQVLGEDHRVFEFEKKQNKQPIAHRKVNLPSNKVILREDGVSRILPKAMLRKCSKKVTILQSKHKGLKEVDIALEIPKVGVFSVETMRTMRNYHRAIDPIAAIDKATVWVATIDFSINIDLWYPVKEDESLLNGLKTTRLQSNEIEILDIVGRGNLTEASSVTKEIPDSGPPSSPPPKATPSAVPGDEDEGITFHDLIALFGSDDDDGDQPRSAQTSSLSATHRPSDVTSPYRSSSDEDDSADDEGPRDPSIAKRPSLPASPSSTPMEVDDNGGRTRKDAGGDSRRDEPSFDFYSGDTAGEEAVPPQPRVQVQLVVLETLSRLHDLMFLVAKVPRLILAVQGRRRDATGISFSYTSPKNTIAANFSSTRLPPPGPAQPLPMSHQVVQGPRPAILPSASFPPWVQPFLDMPFTAPRAKSCFERVLSRVLPDPTPGDVIIRVTIESLIALFDYEDPIHPWQIMRHLLPDEPCLFDIAGFDPTAHVSKRAPYETRFKGFAREASDPNHDRALLKSKVALWRLLLSQRKNRADRLRKMYQDHYMKWCLESVTAPRRSFIRPELIVGPSVPSYPVEPLPFVPKNTDWLAEAAALERRQPWRAAWVFAPFDHPYNTTYVPCHHDAPIISSALQTPLLSVEPL
ncbi:hypothetical protein GQ600_18052 [Phytophthora cactorum]|nr:hypothetical protein GQ600_18052 [Phytophthora cactorum]